MPYQLSASSYAPAFNPWQERRNWEWGKGGGGARGLILDHTDNQLLHSLSRQPPDHISVAPPLPHDIYQCLAEASLGPRPKTNPSADCFQYHARTGLIPMLLSLCTRSHTDVAESVYWSHSDVTESGNESG